MIENGSDIRITGNLMEQGGVSPNANDGIRAIDCQQLQIISNQFKNMIRLSAFTSNSDHIIFSNNMIKVNNEDNFRFAGAQNMIETANIFL